jgi:hypothetical protein
MARYSSPKLKIITASSEFDQCHALSNEYTAVNTGKAETPSSGVRKNTKCKFFLFISETPGNEYIEHGAK